MGITLIDKIIPKNDAFQGMVDAVQVLGGATGSTVPDNAIASSNIVQHQGTIDHGSIAGLGDDDHTQYLLTDGTRALTGNITIGSNLIGSSTTPLLNMDLANKKYVDDNSSDTITGIALSGTAGFAVGSVTFKEGTNMTINRTGSEFEFVAAGGGGGGGIPTFGISGATSVSGAITILAGSNIGIIQGGSNFTFHATSGNGIDHGFLTGLSDDDHTQYLLTDGTRAMTGSLDMTGTDILNIGDITVNNSIFEFTRGGEEVLVLQDITSATSEILISNGTSTGPAITTAGDDANIPLRINPKGSGAISMFEEIEMNSNKIVGMADPTTDQDASTKVYVDNNIGSTLFTDGSKDLVGDLLVSGTTNISFLGSGQFINSPGTGSMLIDGNGRLQLLADSLVTIGTVGNIELGDGTQREMRPQTNERVSLGNSSDPKRFNNIHAVKFIPKTVQTYLPINLTTDRAFDANSTTIAEIADVLGTLIEDLKVVGIIG